MSDNPTHPAAETAKPRRRRRKTRQKGETGRSVNSLDGPKKYMLGRYVDDHRAEIHDRLTGVEVADRATKALGFTVTENNIVTAIESVPGDIQLKPKVRPRTSRRAKVDGHDRALKNLCVELGVDFDAFSAPAFEPVQGRMAKMLAEAVAGLMLRMRQEAAASQTPPVPPAALGG
jgi:hypothetical protein